MTVIKAHAHTKEQTHEAKENALADQYAKQSALTQVHLAQQIKDDLVTPDYFYETLSKLQLKHQTLKKKKGYWEKSGCSLHQMGYGDTKTVPWSLQSLWNEA